MSEEYLGVTPNNNLEDKNTPIVAETENGEFKQFENFNLEPKSNSNTSAKQMEIKLGNSLIFFLVFIIIIISFTIWYYFMIKPGLDLYNFIYMTLLYISPFIVFILVGIQTERKIKLIKDEINNTLTLKVINNFCCPKHTFTFNLQGLTVNLRERTFHYEEEADQIQRKIIISNSFKYNSDTDLNINKIKDKPVESIYYAIKDLKYFDNYYLLLKNFLNNFL